MNSLTLLLAQIIGPILVAASLGFLLSTKHYNGLIKSLEKDPLGLYLAGIFATASGLLIISHHNIWEFNVAGLVTFLGWAMAAKGICIMIVPSLMTKMTKFAECPIFVRIWGFVVLFVGSYMVYEAYFTTAFLS